MSNEPIPFPKKASRTSRSDVADKRSSGHVVPMKGLQMGAVFEMMAVVEQIKQTPIDQRGRAWTKKKDAG